MASRPMTKEEMLALAFRLRPPTEAVQHWCEPENAGAAALEAVAGCEVVAFACDGDPCMIWSKGVVSRHVYRDEKAKHERECYGKIIELARLPVVMVEDSDGK